MDRYTTVLYGGYCTVRYWAVHYWTLHHCTLARYTVLYWHIHYCTVHYCNAHYWTVHYWTVHLCMYTTLLQPFLMFIWLQRQLVSSKYWRRKNFSAFVYKSLKFALSQQNFCGLHNSMAATFRSSAALHWLVLLCTALQTFQPPYTFFEWTVLHIYLLPSPNFYSWILWYSG